MKVMLFIVGIILALSMLVGCGGSYEVNKTDDPGVVQEAVDMLPVFGGVLNFENGHYLITEPVTREIDNVTIMGRDYSNGLPEVYLSNDNETPIFIVGGEGWVFIDIKVDLGGIDFNGHDVVIVRTKELDKALFPASIDEVFIK